MGLPEAQRTLLTKLLAVDGSAAGLEAFVTIRADLTNVGGWTVENIVTILLMIDAPPED